MSMDFQPDFKPNMTDPSLLFTSEDRVSIEDLKYGLRRLLCKYHPPAAVLGLIQSLNWNYLRSRSRDARVILVTSDGSQFAECMLVDVYARLLQHKSTVKTPRASYYVVLEGVIDHQKVNFLAQHYFWMASAFQSGDDQRGQRFLMN